MQLIDTHSHIYYDKYKDDFDEVLKRAKENNLKNIICVGVDIESSEKSILLSEKYNMIYSTAGYHPHESKDANENYLDKLEQLLKHEKVVGVGEIGLDFFYNHSDKQTQIKIFNEQIELANHLNMPCVIHNRNSDKELLVSLKQQKIKKGVIHCFASNLKFAKELLNLNLFLSFTGLLTFNKELENVVNEIPLEKIMIETDSPYLTPKPHRGKRNEPYMVKYVAQKIAEIKKISVDEVANTTTKNAVKFFGL